MQPVIITAAMVGAEVTRDQQPNLPVTPQEIISASVECYEAGAAIIHIHVRDAGETPRKTPISFAKLLKAFVRVVM